EVSLGSHCTRCSAGATIPQAPDPGARPPELLRIEDRRHQSHRDKAAISVWLRRSSLGLLDWRRGFVQELKESDLRTRNSRLHSSQRNLQYFSDLLVRQIFHVIQHKRRTISLRQFSQAHSRWFAHRGDRRRPRKFQEDSL